MLYSYQITWYYIGCKYSPFRIYLIYIIYLNFTRKGSDKVIKVEHLKKTFSIGKNNEFQAIKDVSFQVEQGEIYGVIGLSGAGKSTLVRCINRLEEPTSGKIFIDEVEVTSLKKKDLLEIRKEMSMIFQNFNLFAQKTVFQNIAYPLEITNIEKGKIKERVEELLDFVSLLDKKNSYPSEISGGQKQRVAIARALATNPKIILSDEGTSALDPENTKAIMDLLVKTVETFGTTIILITHQMEVAKEICDRIAVMDDGYIIEENTVEELFAHPKEERTKAFIERLQGKAIGDKILQEDFSGLVVRLRFGKYKYDKPVISNIIRKTGVDLNILAGNIQQINKAGTGYLIVELAGNTEENERILREFEEQDIQVEVLA